jgi:predicted nucleic acid-binding protein
LLVTPVETLTVSRDEPDNRFLECAEAAKADFLITGNLRHFPKEWKGTRVVTARQFADLEGAASSRGV